MLKKNLSEGEKPIKLSRSKIDQFLKCPCCFYLQQKLGISPPSGLPFNLNSAVDALLKREFDSYREKGEPHPLMIQHGIEAVPFQHQQMNTWRNNKKGVEFFHEPTKFTVMGAVDDIWQFRSGELIVVDYKATSKKEPVTIDADWQISYKRQMEVYQWLLRRNGFQVSNMGYFLYCNGRKDRPCFEGRLEFDISLIPYVGNDDWIEPKLQEIFDSLFGSSIPDPGPNCELCQYRIATANLSNLKTE